MIASELLARAPEGLPEPPASVRSARYRGDDQAVELAGFATEDAEGIRELYALLLAFDGKLAAAPSEAIATLDVDRILAVTRGLGRTADMPTPMRHAVHDIRGSALTSLVVEVQRVRRGRAPEDPRALHILTADHLKVMRNAILGLDDEKRDRDLVPSSHSVERLVESLKRARGETTTVSVDCTFKGAITSSCLELGALDRAVLNLVNNALRHSTEGEVCVSLDPTITGDVRIVVANRIDPAHERVLSERFGASLGDLFLETFSTTGSGDGLRICVDFAAAAYGLARSREAVALGIVGARIVEGWFVAWVHWPSVA
ncbi:MAG: HAMP domain-containing histidine kinase [Deltaproteobacteria bacterium]|nr:HAMP domain-containing histidine kinase [Deltaproteobacteria bacterium]